MVLAAIVVGWSLGWWWSQNPRVRVNGSGTRVFSRYGFNRQNNPVFRGSAGGWIDWTDNLGEPLQQASIAPGSGVVYVGGDGQSAHRLYALNARSGQILWRRRLDNLIMTTPLLAGGMVYVGTGNQAFTPAQYRRVQSLAARHIIRGTGTNAIYGISAATGRVVWKFPTRGENMPSFVYKRGVLYTAGGDGRVYAFAAATGTLLWSVPIGSYVSMAAPLLVGDTLWVVGAHPYRLYGIDIASHRVRFRSPLPGVFAGADDCSPVLAEGTVVIEATAGTRDRPRSVAIGFGLNGRLKWQTVLGTGRMVRDIEVAAPSAAGRTVFFGSPLTRREYALDPKTGAVRWTFQAVGPVAETAAIASGRLYFGDEDGWFYVLDAKSGRLVASRYLGGSFAADYPLIAGQTLYQPNENGQMLAMPLGWLAATNRTALPRPSGARGRAVAKGEAAFMAPVGFAAHPSCGSCHRGAGTLAAVRNGTSVPSLLGIAAIFPREKARGWVTLDAQIRRCERAMGGPPLPDGSARLTRLNIYLHWLAQGWPERWNSPQKTVTSGHKGGC